MLVLALISPLVLTGLVPVPFANDFSRGAKYATPGTTPCLAEGVIPVDPSMIQVRILNTVSRRGLASEATALLVNAGYEPFRPSNTSPEYAGVVQTDVGSAAVDETYTVARFFPKLEVVLDESTDRTVTVLLGTFYNSSSVSSEVGRIAGSRDPLKGFSGYLPFSEKSLKKAE